MKIYMKTSDMRVVIQKKEENFCCLVPKISLGEVGPGNFLDFRPAGWSEMAFMATHLSLCGKDK